MTQRPAGSRQQGVGLYGPSLEAPDRALCALAAEAMRRSPGVIRVPQWVYPVGGEAGVHGVLAPVRTALAAAENWVSNSSSKAGRREAGNAAEAAMGFWKWSGPWDLVPFAALGASDAGAGSAGYDGPEA